MRRFAEVLTVLVPVCLFVVGCGPSASTESKIAPPSKESTEALNKQRLEEMQKAKAAMKPAPGSHTPGR